MMRATSTRPHDTLDGFEFLTMAEAGEVGHWEILECTLNKRAGIDMLARRLGAADPAATPGDGALDIPRARGRRKPERTRGLAHTAPAPALLAT